MQFQTSTQRQMLGKNKIKELENIFKEKERREQLNLQNYLLNEVNPYDFYYFYFGI